MKTKMSPLMLRNLAIVLAMSFSATLAVNKSYAQNDQKKFGITLRAGADFATVKLGDASLKTGFGMEGTFSYLFMKHFSAYAGWGWNKFTASESFAGNNVDFEETGYTAGLQFSHYIADSKFSYIVGAGAIYNHIEVENTDGDIIADSKHGFGWQGEAGLAYDVTDYLRITPTVRYRALMREIKIEDISTNVDLNYISAALALTWRF